MSNGGARNSSAADCSCCRGQGAAGGGRGAEGTMTTRRGVVGTQGFANFSSSFLHAHHQLLLVFPASARLAAGCCCCCGGEERREAGSEQQATRGSSKQL